MSLPDPPANRKPRLAITVGDVAGVGPELALTCAADRAILTRCTPILVGPSGVLAKVADRRGLALPPTVDPDALVNFGEAAVLDCGEVDPTSVQPGVFSAATGRASFQAVEWAIRAAMDGRVDAVVTGPIQKEAWHDAGTGFLGHTELLAERTQTDDVCMMLAGPDIACILCTIHLPLAEVPASLSADVIERAIRLGGLAMERKLNRPPRIAVLGLNPHAGENGLMSRGEESELIVPAIENTRTWMREQSHDWQMSGPLPPDTAFTPAMRDKTDLHVCMYHDQGLIPLKALSFDDAVNVTLGLPIVRTSVDHGTALDLAWQGVASSSSIRAAINMAIDLCGASF